MRNRLSKVEFEKIFYRLFYSLWLIVWAYSIYEPLVFDRQTGVRFIYSLFWPHLNFISYHYALIFFGSFILAPLIFPQKQWARVVGFLGILGSSTIALEEYSVYSYLNIWIYSALYFCFAGRGWFSFEKAILMPQFQWSIIMLVSGLHKIMVLFEAGNDLAFSEIMQYTTANIFISKSSLSPIGSLIMASPSFAAFSWIVGIALEISIFLLFIFVENKLFAGALAVSFHFMTLMTLRVHYMDTAICLIVIYILGGSFLLAQKETVVLRFSRLRPYLKFSF